jgi:hypothetical protein
MLAALQIHPRHLLQPRRLVARGGFGLAKGPDGTGDISFEELPPGLVQGDVSHISLLSGVSATGGLRNPR